MNDKHLIIQDVDSSLDSGSFFYAGPKTVRCKGCFHCWLKIPGQCCIGDRSETIGSRIAVSETVSIVSKTLYGGFGLPVKRVLDRGIPGVLPFFRWIHGRMHHAPRYQNQPVMHIYFYGEDTMTEQERHLAEKAARAMSINFNAKSCTVSFSKEPPSWEVL